MNRNQLKAFFELLDEGIDRQVAVESLGVPYEPVQERLNIGQAEALEGKVTEDSKFYLKVKKAEANWEIRWYREKVLAVAGDATDVTKAFEPLARKKPSRYASPGTLKVFDAESGGKGPGAALARATQELEEEADDED